MKYLLEIIMFMKANFLIVFVILFVSTSVGQNKIINNLLTDLQNTKNDTIKINLLNDLAWEFTKIDAQRAVDYAKEAEKLSEITAFRDSLPVSLVRIGTAYIQLNELEAAKIAFEDALKLEEKAEHIYGIARASNQLGRVCSLQGKLSEAIVYYEKALKAFNAINKKKQIAKISNNIGVLYKKMGKYDSAVEYYLAALKIREGLGDERQIAFSNSNLGALFIEIEEPLSALEYLNKSKEVLEKLDDIYELSDVYTNIGTANFRMHKDSIALNFYEKAITINQELNLEYKNIDIYSNIGSIYYKKDSLDKTLDYYQKSLSISKNTNTTRYNAEIYCNIGNVKFKQGRFKEAIQYYTKALKYAQSSNGRENIVELYNNLSFSYSQLKLLDSALYYKNQYIDVKDSLYSASKNAIITNANSEEEQMDLHIFAKDKLIAAKDLHTANLKNYGLLIGLFLFALLLIAFVRGNKQKRKADLAIIEQQKVEKLLKNQELKSINAMIEGQEGERQRIARDLHDRLGSILSMVKVHFMSVEENIEELKVSNKKQYDKANELLDNACDEVRKISHDMASGVLIKFGLVAAIEDLKETLEESNRIEVEFISHGLYDRLDNTIEIAIYRIIQELISNILKYAKATSITIQLISNENNLNVSVEDDGIGFDINDKKNWGIGLTNVASRVDALGGDLQIDSMIDKGTSISIDIPIKEI